MAHPEVLVPDWVPPVPICRRTEVDAAYRAVQQAWKDRRPAVATIVGPSGAGTSTVARVAARLLADDLRRAGASPPLVVAVRARECRAAWGIATSLLRRLDDGFSGRGFHATEIVAGFLRRLRRDQRSAVVVLDDVAPAVGDLTPILTAFVHPDRFLPEGEHGLPPLALLVAGVPEATAVWGRLDRLLPRPRIVVPVRPYSTRDVAEILLDRAARALGRPPPDAWAERLRGVAEERGLGLAAGMEHLRRALAAPRPTPAVPGPGERGPAVTVEPRLLAALARVAERRQATIAELREWEREFATAEGVRPLPATTFWRRIVRLESIGVVHREVRTGGPGGTRSVVEILRPLTAPERDRGTLPADGLNPLRGAAPAATLA